MILCHIILKFLSASGAVLPDPLQVFASYLSTPASSTSYATEV